MKQAIKELLSKLNNTDLVTLNHIIQEAYREAYYKSWSSTGVLRKDLNKTINKEANLYWKEFVSVTKYNN